MTHERAMPALFTSANMLKQFYEKVLPKQGVYCVGELDRSKPKGEDFRNRFTRTLDEVYTLIEGIKSRKHDAYVAMGTFNGFSRVAKNCVYSSSLFIDLDVGEGKPYKSKEEALSALNKFVETTQLPPPVRLDSGNGIHSYWPFDEDIPAKEYLPCARQWKKLCMQHLQIDPLATPANLAQVMRWADSVNYRFDPPSQTKFLDEEIYVYSFEAFKEFLGVEELDEKEILENVSKGLDEDTRAMLKLDNFAKSFETLAEKSLNGEGCQQISNILINSKTLEEPLWWAGLSIAKFCDDAATAIHKMSEDYDGYNYEDTEEKASRFPAPRTCEWFNNNYPEHCKDCQHRGSINSPIALAKEFKPATNKAQSVRTDESAQKIPDFPEFLFPFLRGEHGGVYYQPPHKIDKKGNKIELDPVLLIPYDFFPIRRMISKHDGECLLMQLILPKDPTREILVPMKHVYALENFKAIMSSNGIFPPSNLLQHLMNYVIKWGQFMQLTDKAEVMRMQMGWTESISEEAWNTRSFVVGSREITIAGDIVDAPCSPFVRGIAKHLNPQGTYERWRESVDYLNAPGFEIHAFAMLCGLGSPYMVYTSTSGVTVCLLGKSGSAKTGAMYAGLSAWGNPKELSVFEATENGMTGRFLGLHNLPLGIDEISNKEAKILSQLTHKISNGKAKIRMQASVNAEREHEMSASMIALMTTNQSAYGKFESIKANPDGEAARMIEFLVRKPPMLEGEGGGNLGRHIFNALNFNYGHAGPMVIKEGLRLGDNYILETIEKWNAKFVKDFGDDATYRFYQNLIGASCTAGEMAVGANIITLDIERVYHEVIREMITIRDKVVKVNRTDYPSVLGDYINRNMGNILVLKDGRVTMEPRGQIVGRIVSEESLLQVSKTDFKKYLNERQISSREFEFEMREKKILIDDKKGRLTTGWKTAIHVDPAYLYWFKTELPDGFFDDA